MDLCSVLVHLTLCAVWHADPALGQSQVDMNVLTRLENLEKQVSGQQYQLEVQNKLIADLQTRVTDQESAISKQQATINEQQTTILKQQKTVSEQQNEMSKQRSSLSEQHRRLIWLEGILLVYMKNKGNRTGSKLDIAGVKIDTRSEPVETNSDEDKLQDHGTTHTIRRLNQRLVLESGSPVAFHAVQTAGEIVHTGIHQNIQFHTVMLNLGAGYHNQHGVFIAPAAGLYIFSTSIMANHDNSPIEVSLMKNGAVQARSYAHGDSGLFDQGSVTIVTQLAIGDEVWVSNYNTVDASYYGDLYTSFTGCLLWPL